MDHYSRVSPTKISGTIESLPKFLDRRDNILQCVFGLRKGSLYSWVVWNGTIYIPFRINLFVFIFCLLLKLWRMRFPRIAQLLIQAKLLQSSFASLNDPLLLPIPNLLPLRCLLEEWGHSCFILSVKSKQNKNPQTTQLSSDFWLHPLKKGISVSKWRTGACYSGVGESGKDVVPVAPEEGTAGHHHRPLAGI